MSGRLTASAMARAHACPASFALPQVQHQETKEARRGTWRHKFLQMVADGIPPADAIEEVPMDCRDECAGIDTRGIPPGGETEVPMAYDTRTGNARKLDTQDRNYDVAETEIPGTADLVLWADPVAPGGPDNRPIVIDWKGSIYGTDQTAVDAQLEFLGLMVARITGCDSVCVWAGFVGDNGAIGWRKRTLDWEDLAKVAARSKAALQAIQSKVAERASNERWVQDVTTGSHCRYCPAFVHCPAKRAVMEGWKAGEEPESFRPEQAGDAYLRAKDAERWAEYTKSVVKELVVMHGPLTLDGNRVVKLDARGALRIARNNDS